MGLTAEVPLDLRVDAGAARTVLDLRDLKLRNLELHTGASATRVLLPRSAGATTVRAETGAAELVFEIPTGVAARIRSRMVLGSTHIDEGRFPPAGGGHESPDYATSPNRVDIDVQGGGRLVPGSSAARSRWALAQPPERGLTVQRELGHPDCGVRCPVVPSRQTLTGTRVLPSRTRRLRGASLPLLCSQPSLPGGPTVEARR